MNIQKSPRSLARQASYEHAAAGAGFGSPFLHSYLWRLLPALRSLALALLLAATPLATVAAQNLLWMRQTGTAAFDSARGIAVDGSGNAYMTGSTSGSFGGSNAGRDDVFLAKYDASGTRLWLRQTGSAGGDVAFGVAADVAGNAYVAGYTTGTPAGPNPAGASIFLAKYDAAGTLLWARQADSTFGEFAFGVAVDSGGDVYITGVTFGTFAEPGAGAQDIFLAKYDGLGTLLWRRQTGSAGDDVAQSVAVDSVGNSYITGYTSGWSGAGYFDSFLAKYDAVGTMLWMRQAGTSGDDRAFGVAVDAMGNAYITGYTSGNLVGPNIGEYDVFLAKYDASGNLIWMRQSGSAVSEGANGVAVDDAGNAYITGNTRGNFGGPNAGEDDTFLAKYDASGNLVWLRQTGTAAIDGAGGVAVDGAGNAYITGSTIGDIAEPNAGGSDVFIALWGRSCNPPTISSHPTALTVCRQMPASFNVAASGVGPFNYHWRRTGVPINPALNPSAITNTLQFAHVQASDGGSYDCIVTDSCRSATSNPATLTTRYCACVLADIAGGGPEGLEGDGIIDGSDFIAFINSFAAGDVNTDPRADVAGGGPVGLDPDGIVDGTDFIVFINVFSAGC